MRQTAPISPSTNLLEWHAMGVGGWPV
jgi:hypothetical protein